MKKQVAEPLNIKGHAFSGSNHGRFELMTLASKL